MSADAKRKIDWYRSPVGREKLIALNQRSDWLGMCQTLGHLGLLTLTGVTAWMSSSHHLWALFPIVLYFHGLFTAFLLNAFHELCHGSVFKTRRLNFFFLNIISFLSWNNPVLFWASHQEHHKYTLHPPEDLEVVVPIKITWFTFLKNLFVNPWDLYGRLKSTMRLSLGRLEGEWENELFPPGATTERRKLFAWARILLAGHLCIIGIAVVSKLWLLPVLITFAPFYGGGLQFLCNNTQHTGLSDNVDDFRSCTRTILLNPFLQVLYWHMNYHIEHHMYAAVPCYNLGKLHAEIKADLPPSPTGLYAAWKQIIPLMSK
jgi:fatty acid desaturase